MKKLKWFILATLVIAFLSCSKNYNETLDQETSLDSQTRGENSQNDSKNGAGMNAKIIPRDTVSEDIVLTPDPIELVKNDSIPSDTIPSDSSIA